MKNGSVSCERPIDLAMWRLGTTLVVTDTPTLDYERVVGKPVPLDGNRQTDRRKPDQTDPEGIRPNPMKNRKQGLIRKYVPMRMLMLVL